MRRYTLNYLLYAFIILGLAGAYGVNKAFADSRHDTGDVIVNLPEGSGCTGVAAAMAAGGHQYFVTPKAQMSVGMAYYDNCGAASIGSAISTGSALWSGALTCNEDTECGGSGSVTIKFN